MLENHVISRLGSRKASELTAGDLNLVMADMAKAGKSVTTIRYMLRIVHRVLDDAVRKGKLLSNVAELADPPSAKKAETEIWDIGELGSFLTAAADSPFYPLFATLALIGARRGEGFGLKWGDMDLNNESPSISIRRSAYKIGKEWRFEEPKTRRSRRVVALPLSLARVLRYWREQQESNARYYGRQLSENDFVFARDDGTLPDPDYVSKVFQRIVKDAGLKRIRLHDLRHTYATLQRKAGQPIEVISRVLGHASEMVTLTIYNHWEGGLRAAADTMDLMLERISKEQDENNFVRNPLEELEENERIEYEPWRTRTSNLMIKSHLLYQLS
jgi:integrase